MRKSPYRWRILASIGWVADWSWISAESHGWVRLVNLLFMIAFPALMWFGE